MMYNKEIKSGSVFPEYILYAKKVTQIYYYTNDLKLENYNNIQVYKYSIKFFTYFELFLTVERILPTIWWCFCCNIFFVFYGFFPSILLRL